MKWPAGISSGQGCRCDELESKITTCCPRWCTCLCLSWMRCFDVLIANRQNRIAGTPVVEWLAVVTGCLLATELSVWNAQLKKKKQIRVWVIGSICNTVLHSALHSPYQASFNYPQKLNQTWVHLAWGLLGSVVHSTKQGGSLPVMLCPVMLQKKPNPA